MENPKFVLKKTEDNQFHFTLQAKNGETIMQSETYTEKHNALNGIESVISSVLLMRNIGGILINVDANIEDLT